MTKKSISSSILGFFTVLLALLITSSHANAYTLSAEALAAYETANAYGDGFGDLVGVYDGNSTLSNVSSILGTEVKFLADSDEPNSNFSFDTLYFKDSDPNEPVIGTWDYNPLAGVVDYMVVKASTQFAIYAYDSAIAGGWSSLDIIKTFGNLNEPFSMSHLTAVSAVPLPAAAPLFLSALAIFGFVTSRRKKQK